MEILKKIMGKDVKIQQSQIVGSPIKKSVRGLTLKASGTNTHNNDDLIGANGVIIYFYLGTGYPMSAVYVKETVDFDWLQYLMGGLSIYIQARFTVASHYVSISQYSTVNDSVKIIGYDIF